MLLRVSRLMVIRLDRSIQDPRDGGRVALPDPEDHQDPLARLEHQVIKELVVKLVNQVHRVHLALEDLPDHRAHLDLKVMKVPLETQAPLAQQALLVKVVDQACQEYPDLKDIVGSQEEKAKKVNQDGKEKRAEGGLLVQLVPLVRAGPVAHLENEVEMVHLACRGLEVKMEPQAALDLLDQQDHLATLAFQELKDKREMLAHMANLATLAPQAQPVLMDHLDPLEMLELLGHQVKTATMDRRVTKAL